MKPSFIAMLTRTVSRALARLSPCPVIAFVLLIFGLKRLDENMASKAFPSLASPISVEVAWALT